MEIGEIIAIVVSGAVACLLAVVFLRAALFHPKKAKQVGLAEETFDKEKSLERFRALIRVPTVSYHESEKEDAESFRAFIALLKELYPKVHETCTPEEVQPRGLLYRWKGQKEGAVSVFMSHFDVVPADGQWEHPPFSADLADGRVWGRGTLDTKGTLCGILESAEHLMEEGFRPRHDVYFSFGGDEEIRGDSTPNLVELFRERGIEIAMVLDEGGAVVEGVFPGVKTSCALVGTAEKGIMDVTMTLNSEGGHASSPLPETALSDLMKSARKIIEKPGKMRITPPAEMMFDTLGRHSNFAMRVLFSNLWLFRPVLNLVCKKSGGEMNALVRTTKAFTVAKGSEEPNVLPLTASVTANVRIIPGETVESVCREMKRAAKNSEITWSLRGEVDPSPVSKTDSEGYGCLEDSIRATWGDVIVSPYLMIACSDSRHYARISDKVYRFSAMAFTKSERGLIHAANESIPVETFYKTVAFYKNLMAKR